MKIVSARVHDIRHVSDDVKIFRLTTDKGERLPGFSPGSHILVRTNLTGPPRFNAYSLISDPWDMGPYEIAVLRRQDSHGGSVFLHDHVRAGSLLDITYPNNSFAINSLATRHILIAGGIGATPFITYARHFARTRADFELHYAVKSVNTAPFHPHFAASVPHYAPYSAADGNRIVVGDVLKRAPTGAHAYVCGPRSLIDDVISAAKRLNWPRTHVHYELFDRSEGGEPFDFELNRSGLTGSVPRHGTLLEALESSGVDIPYGCRSGACGLCATGVVSGDIEHRDCYLSDHQKQSGAVLLPCVSRGRDKIVLDL